MRIIERTTQALRALDELVFPKNPLKAVYIVQSEKKGRIVAYVRKKSMDKFQSLPYYFISGPAFRNEYYIIHKPELLRFEKKEKGKGNNTEELIISLVAHEVRHRLQFRSKTKLFTPGIGRRIPVLKGLAEALEAWFNHNPSEEYQNEKDKKLEFDARIIELLVKKAWREGERDISRIVKLVKLEPKTFS